jgi:hypothetical protein
VVGWSEGETSPFFPPTPQQFQIQPRTNGTNKAEKRIGIFLPKNTRNITKNQEKTNRKVEKVEKVGRKAMKWSLLLRLCG